MITSRHGHSVARQGSGFVESLLALHERDPAEAEAIRAAMVSSLMRMTNGQPSLTEQAVES